MKVWSPVTIGVAAGAAGFLAGAGVIASRKLRRKKDPAELERLRRTILGRTGRIVSGEITGIIEPEGKNQTPLLLVYRYEIAGVSYEVAQDVSMMPQVAANAAHLVGKAISAKYEMKHPSNSIIVCEEWSGIRGIDLRESNTADVSVTSGQQPPGESATKL